MTRARKFRLTLSSRPPTPRCGVVYWRWWWLERCTATWDWKFEPVPVEQISPRGFLSAKQRTYPPRSVGFGINRLQRCSFFHLLLIHVLRLIPACYACCCSFCLVLCRFKHDNMCLPFDTILGQLHSILLISCSPDWNSPIMWCTFQTCLSARFRDGSGYDASFFSNKILKTKWFFDSEWTPRRSFDDVRSRLKEIGEDRQMLRENLGWKIRLTVTFRMTFVC